MNQRFSHPETPFPVGVEYYRGGTPAPEWWDGDFARIRAAGLRIVRSASYWNWMEPSPGDYQLDDVDLLFDTARKHKLSVWIDIMLSTHGACPEWLTRELPDMGVVNRRGQRLMGDGHPAYPQGGMIHCYDHPAWRQHGGALLRHVVNRYKDHPSLLIWGLWDGINLSSAWVGQDEGGYPCYCPSTLARYDAWLRKRFTLDELNHRVSRRYGQWEDLEPPRNNNNVAEMLLFRQFHYENLADHLRWMIALTREIDPEHETRTHGGWRPRPWDETCAREADSWGMSMPSNNLLTSDDPHKISERAFAFDWSWSLGREGRWWNEEIYAGMSSAGVTWKKQTDPRELTTLLWMTLAHGAAGAMFWQYRPDYASFESPGYNLVALDGEPTPRFEAVAEALRHIEGLSEHLPPERPRAEVAVVNHQASHEVFGFNGEGDRFLADLRGAYRTLWAHSIPADVVTPSMDWSDYRLVFLPNVALMTDEVLERITSTLREPTGARLVAEGSFGLYSANGMSSYRPPEGLADVLNVRVADFSRIDERDIAQGRNILDTPYGPVSIETPCGYAVFEPRAGAESIATLNGRTVGVRTLDGRFTWYGLTTSAGFGDVGSRPLVLGLAGDAAVQSPFPTSGDRLITVARKSRQGGWLVFVFNVEPTAVTATLSPRRPMSTARDLLNDRDLGKEGDSFRVTVDGLGVVVLHCTER